MKNLELVNQDLGSGLIFLFSTAPAQEKREAGGWTEGVDGAGWGMVEGEVQPELYM
jgi:hypothetical protein